MATVKDIEVGGKKITVRQLTVEQVTELLEQSDVTRKVTTAELLVQSKMPIEAVAASTGMSIEELNGKLLQDELAVIYQAAEEVNPAFLALTERLVDAAASMPPKESDEPPAS